MTVHRDRFLVNKTNRCTEFQFYWYYDSTCFGQSFCPSSGVLSRTPALVQFMQFGDRVLPDAGWNSMEFHPAPGSTRSPNCINCTNAVVRLRSSWWWAERLPETCRVVIPIKLELSASVSFIHKEPLIHISKSPKTILEKTLWMWQWTSEFLLISETSRLCQQILASQELWSMKIFYVPCYVPRKLSVYS
jgi:hypothetical protein